MAFQDSNPFGVLADTQSPSPAAAAAAGSPPQVQLVGAEGEEPLEVVIENVGFLALGGDTKVKILPKGYDKDSLPSSSASLFSIANRSGLFAAAAHSDFVVGSTSSLRETFAGASDGIEEYRPQLSFSLPANISHIAFTADESHLVVGSASGGLAVYSVSALNNSNAQPLFELGTGGVGLREMKPNPATPELVAVVTTNGDVQMVNISTGGWEEGSNGSVLKTGASTVSWSQRGKQIVCGMGDGTGWQMTPQGEGKAVLPSVPGLENHFVSSIVWLENNLFITTHTPVPTEPQNNDSLFHVLVRTGSSFTYTRLPDPVPPYGLDSRTPPYFFHALIKQYAPSLKDMIIFSNTCSSDIGLISRFSTAVAGEPPAPADAWITSSIGDDTRRAQLPLSGTDFQDTSVMGMALDLSNKENVKRPVGGEEIEESPGPLPILMVLNHEGLLCAWHVIYNDAMERREKYTGMMVYSPQDQQQQQQQQQPPRPGTPPRTSFAAAAPTAGTSSPFGAFASKPGPSAFGTTRPAFGAPSFGTPSMGSHFAGAASAQTSGSAFGQPSALGASSPFAKAAAMGSTTSGSAFGQTSALGQTSGTAFGQPSVLGGTSSPFAKAAASGTAAGSAFGQPSALGGSPSPFANAASVGPATSTPAFGAPTSLGIGKSSTSGFGQAAPLGSTGALGSLSSGFGAYADKAGFAAAAAPSADATPVWASSGKGFNTDPTPSAFTASNTSGFGSLAGSGFKISSGFKPDSSTADETTAPSNAGSGFGLGGGFRDALGTAQATPRGFNDQGPKDADMDSDAEQDNNASDDDEDAPPPTRLQGGPSQPTASASFLRTGGLPSGIFAKASAEASKSSPFASVNKPAGSESPFAQSSPFGAAVSQSSPFGAGASGSPFAHGKAAFAPLPPSSTPSPFSGWGSVKQTTSPFTTGAQPMKPAFGSTGFGAFAPKPQPSSIESSTPPVTGQPEAAPLPPDFTLPKAKSETTENVVPDAPLPPDFTSTKKETKQELNAEDAPLPPDFTSVKKEAKQDSNAEDAPLPPDFTSQKKADKEDRLESAPEDAPLPPDFTKSKEKTVEEEIPSLPADESEDEGIEEETFDDDEGDNEQDDEEDDGEGEEDEDEEEDEEDEDEEEDEEDEDEDEDGEEDVWLKEQQERPVTPKEFNYEPKPKLSTTSPSTSNIFGSNTSFKDTIGTVDKAAPFAGLFGSKSTPSKEIEHGKTPTKTSSLFGAPKSKSPGHGVTPPSGKDKLSRSGSGMGGSGMFSKAKKVGAAEIGKSVTTPAPASSSSPFPTPSPIPAPAPTAFSAATNKAGFAAPSSGSPPASTFPQPSLAPRSLGSTPPAVGRPQPSPFNRTASAPSPLGGTNFGSPTAQLQTRSSPLSAPSFQQAPKEAEKIEEPDSDLDLDKEFDELDDEKVRRKLQRGTIKPLENLPKIKNMGEIQLSDDFNEVFDAIYLNGNMMVNRLGLTVRGMAAYHMAQTQLIADCKHESAKDMKQPKDWKLCELEKVRKILEEVLDGVKKENKGNEELEAQYEAANKGFIKLDTKDAEIKRLLAVHNDPRAAALARARTLTSEQHLQQIKLRKEYTRVEKLLKDAEKEVTQLKAKIASRDKNNAGTVVPPTVEAVRNTIMKLTGMVERKNGDIEYLADRLNRVKLKSRSISVTPGGRSRLMSPDIGVRSEAPSMRFSTPERGLGGSIGPSFGSVPTPVLTLTDPTDVAVAREEKKARREMGNRLRGVLEKNGPRVTGGQGQGNYFMK